MATGHLSTVSPASFLVRLRRPRSRWSACLREGDSGEDALGFNEDLSEGEELDKIPTSTKLRGLEEKWLVLVGKDTADLAFTYIYTYICLEI